MGIRHALGCMVGAAVGDAAGGTLEFQDDIDLADVDHALSMPGGGWHRLGPGQVTDDTELALSMATGLLQGSSLEAVARAYSAWFGTHPFDVGRTCNTAFSAPITTRTAQAMAQHARASAYSKANGALMRVHPAAVYACKFGDARVAELARADAGLSHPNPVAAAANACYAVAVANLLRTPGDSQGAFQAALRLASGEVRAWLLEAERGEIEDVRPQQGFVRWAFTLAFLHLLRRTGYRAAVRDTIARGVALFLCGWHHGARHRRAPEALPGRPGRALAPLGNNPRRPRLLGVLGLPSAHIHVWAAGACGSELPTDDGGA